MHTAAQEVGIIELRIWKWTSSSIVAYSPVAAGSPVAGDRDGKKICRSGSILYGRRRWHWRATRPRTAIKREWKWDGHDSEPAGRGICVIHFQAITGGRCRTMPLCRLSPAHWIHCLIRKQTKLSVADKEEIWSPGSNFRGLLQRTANSNEAPSKLF